MLEVNTTRTIKVGRILLIHPTQAFLGIDRGVIKVVSIHDTPAMDAGATDAANKWIRDLTCGNPDDAEVAALTDECMNQPWVSYVYTAYSSHNPASQLGEVQYLPLDVFAGSVTDY